MTARGAHWKGFWVQQERIPPLRHYSFGPHLFQSIVIEHLSYAKNFPRCQEQLREKELWWHTLHPWIQLYLKPSNTCIGALPEAKYTSMVSWQVPFFFSSFILPSIPLKLKDSELTLPTVNEKTEMPRKQLTWKSPHEHYMAELNSLPG